MKFSLPLLVGVCIDRREVDGQTEVCIAGCNNLHDAENVPSIMLIAAAVLQIPGFAQEVDDIEIAVH